MTVFIKVLREHILHMKVLQFIFHISETILCADHGIIFVYTLHRSGYYCGKRVPWMLILPTEEAYLHMIRVSNVKYQLKIFYSSFQKNWIKQLIRVKQMNLQRHSLIYTSEENNINSMQYYILTNYINCMELHVSSSGVGNCSLSLHDGPGALSRSMLQVNNTSIPGVSMVITSAYWAFLAILFPDNHVTDINLTISIGHANNKNTIPINVDTYYVHCLIFHPNVVNMVDLL